MNLLTNGTRKTANLSANARRELGDVLDNDLDARVGEPEGDRSAEIPDVAPVTMPSSPCRLRFFGLSPHRWR